MAKVNLSQAAKLTGKNRTTIWRHIHSGKLSIERDRDRLPFVDTSELIRVYGELTSIATDSTEKKSHGATPSFQDLVEVIELLRKEQAQMKVQISDLTNRLSYTAHEQSGRSQLENSKATPRLTAPEDDHDWPKKVTTMADVAKRNEIKLRYK